MRRRHFIHGVLGLATAANLPQARAQRPYPDRPITFVVPFAAGGGGDLVARLIGQEVSERTKTPVVVDNKAGAGGNIGAAVALKAKPDGYTALSMSATYAIQAALAKPPFDAIADMQPVVMISRDPALLIVGAGSPLKSIQDLVSAAKARPGKLTYGSAGPGSSAHVGLEDLATQLGVQLTHVPYKGTAQAFNDLLAGTIDMMFTSTAHGTPLIRAGQIRALGVAGRGRLSTLPQIPTIAEQGAPGYVLFDWKAVAVPRGVAPEIVAFLNRTINDVLGEKRIRERFELEGSTVVGGTPDQMLEVVRADIERWQTLARKTNLRLE